MFPFILPLVTTIKMSNEIVNPPTIAEIEVCFHLKHRVTAHSHNLIFLPDQCNYWATVGLGLQ